MGMEEIAVAWPAVFRWRDNGGSTEHHLVDHKLAIILSDGTGCSDVSGIRKIGTARPFPSLTPCESTGSYFPFKFRWQPHSFPCGEGGCFVITYVRQGLIQFQWLNSCRT